MTTLQTVLTVAATATSSATLAAGKHTPVDATAGPLTMTLPTPATVGARLRIEKIDASANAVVISGTIRGGTSTLSLASQYQTVELVAESLSSWRPSAGYTTGSGGGGGVPASRAINTAAPLAGGGTLSTDLTLTVGDATTSAKGVVQLAGDLAGTAAAPTVPGLAGKANDNAVVHNTGNETIGGTKTFGSAPVVPAGAFPESAVSGLTTDLAAKAPTSRQVIAGTGLTGGGDLSADRTLAVSFGSSAGTAAQGNDSRIVGAVQSSLATTKGDIFVATAAGTLVRVGVGADGYALVADAAQAAGVKWAQVAAGTKAPVTLTDGPTITTDASQSSQFRVTLTASGHTLANPTNGTDCQLVMWHIKQDATGSRTLTLDTKFHFGTDITSITLSTTPGATDKLGCQYSAPNDRWDVVSFVRGY